MGPFAPSIHAARAAGVNVQSVAYPSGAEGLKMSLDEVAQKIRDGAGDPGIKAHAVQALAEARIDGRDNPSVAKQAGAVLSYVQRNTIYTPDPGGAESIQAAHVTLCVRDMCIRAGDCDDLTVATGAIMLSIGLPVYAVKIRYPSMNGYTPQQHVLIGLKDERGQKLYADPSTRDPVKTFTGAEEEVWIDPVSKVNSVGTSGAEMITLGRPKVVSAPQLHEGRWWLEDDGRWYVHDQDRWWLFQDGTLVDTGVGATKSTLGPKGRDEFERKGGQHGLGAICSLDQLVAYRDRIFGPWEALVPDVRDCPAITIDQKYAFDLDTNQMRLWYNAPAPYCDADAEIREGQDLEARYNGWRKLITSLGCKPSSPELPPLSDNDPKSPNYKAPENDTIKTIKTIGGIVAVAGGIGVTIYGLKLAAEALRTVRTLKGAAT